MKGKKINHATISMFRPYLLCPSNFNALIQRTASCTIVDGASSVNIIYKRVRILSVEGPGVGPAPALAWKYLPSSAHAQKRTVKVPTGSAHLPEFTSFSAVCK